MLFLSQRTFLNLASVTFNVSQFVTGDADWQTSSGLVSYADCRLENMHQWKQPRVTTRVKIPGQNTRRES